MWKVRTVHVSVTSLTHSRKKKKSLVNERSNTGPEFHNLDVLVIIRSLARLLPIALIPFLIPDGAPSDEAKTAKLEGEGGGGGLAFKDSIAVTDLDDDDDDHGIDSPVVSVAVLRRASSSSDGCGGVRTGGMEMAPMDVTL